MAGSRVLRRLLRLLELEEEQARGALEAVLGELRGLETARASAGERERRGRRLVTAAARNGDLSDRLAGLEEARAARRLAGALKPRIAEVELEAARRREVFLARRVERRQAETLVREAREREAIEGNRASQQSMDEWFLNRRSRPGLAAKADRARRG